MLTFLILYTLKLLKLLELIRTLVKLYFLSKSPKLILFTKFEVLIIHILLIFANQQY